MNINAKIRKDKKLLLQTKPPKQRAEADEVIQDRIWTDPHFAACKSLCVFVPTEYEPALYRVIQTARERGAKVYAPKVCGDRLRFYLWDETTRWTTSGFGIAEPQGGEEATDADLILVPMVAYRGLDRLGHGKGYYDRFLANAKGYKMGVAYACQRADFEVLPHDQPMDKVITEEEICE